MQFTRCFSSFQTPLLREWRLVTTRRVAKTPEYAVGDMKPVGVPKVRPLYPVYEYGESNIFKQSNRGLYGGQFIQFGNSISESKKKNRRTWQLNVFEKKFWSDTLQKYIDIKMTGKVYRTITKEGGIDNYLTKNKSARVKELGPTGWKLRYLVLKYQNLKERLSSNVVEYVEAPVEKEGVSSVVSTPVYHIYTKDGEEHKITVGKRKLLYHLYPLELVSKKSQGEHLNFSRFNMEHQKFSVDEILQKLVDHGFDLKHVSV